jgi:AcrR family transcriptional regulator
MARALRRRGRPNPSTERRKQPRQRRSAATVEALVEAAARILADEGAAALTTNRVAKRAGVSIGSLYQYFPNRFALLRALVEREHRRALAARPAAIDDPSLPLATRMRAVVDWHCDVHGSPVARGLRELVASAVPAPLRARYAASRARRVRATVGALVSSLPGRDPARAAFVVDVCLDALADVAAARRPSWLRDAALREEIALLLTRYLEA